MRIIDLNSSRTGCKRIATSIFRFVLLLILGIGFYYMTQGV